MGCGSSAVYAVPQRSNRRYHGVAPVEIPVANLATTPIFSHSSISEVSELLGREGVSSVGPKRTHVLRGAQYGSQGRVLAGQNESSVSSRHDYLLSFGDFKLQMVDELVLDASYSNLSGMGISAASSLTSCHTTVTPIFGKLANSRGLDVCAQVSPTTPPAGGTGTGGDAPSSSLSSSLAAQSPRRIQRYALKSCTGHPHRVKFTLLSPSEELMFSCGIESNSVIVYHTRMRCEIGRLVGHVDPILGGTLSSDGLLVATVSRDRTLIVWDVSTCKMRRSLTHPQAPLGCHFSPDGREIVSACQDGVCRVWDVFAGTETYQFTGHTGAVQTVAYVPDGLRVLSGGSDQRVLVWSKDAKDVLAFRAHAGIITHIEAHRRGSEYFVVSADERLVLVWNLSTQDICKLYDAALVPVPASLSTSETQRHAHWTAACFCPGPFKDYVLLAASNNTLYVCNDSGHECVLDEVGGAAPRSDQSGASAVPGHQLAPAAVAPRTAVSIADVFSMPPPLSASVSFESSSSPISQATAPAAVGIAADKREVVLALPFCSSVRALGAGSKSCVAVGDEHGNTYQLTLQ